jgi:aquaporin Z
MEPRKLVAEALGTALLVIVGVGVATLSFGFKLAGSSTSAGVVATALAFGFILLALAYTLGPVSGAHVNPAVTLGFVVSGRMAVREALGYWVAQFVGGVIGAVVLCAFATEVVLTFVFVLVVLIATSRIGSPGFAGLAIGVGLMVVHLIGIPLTGTSVNPARSLGPAIIVGHEAIKQVWLFIVAPLVGGSLSALVYRYLIPEEPVVHATAVAEGVVERTTATP